MRLMECSDAPVDEACLLNTARYLHDANQKSLIKSEQRYVKLSSWYRWTTRLHIPLFLQLCIMCSSLIFRPPRFMATGSALIADHASEVIRHSLTRVLGDQLPQIRVVRPGRWVMLCQLKKSVWGLTRVFRQVQPVTDFDRARLFRLLSYYVSCRAVLMQETVEAVYLARTNDQKRLALGVAAAERQIPVVAWTVERSGVRAACPFPLAAQLCWSGTQRRHLEGQGERTCQMPIRKQPFRRLNTQQLRSGALGLLLNARVDVVRLKRLLHKLSNVYGIEGIQVRPHPGSLLSDAEVAVPYKMRDWREPLGAYLDSVDAVMSMTSSTIFDALLHGVPVLYVGTLDDLPYDYWGLVANGSVPELKEGADPVHALTDHYLGRQLPGDYAWEEYSDDPVPERQMVHQYGPFHRGG